MSIVTISTGSIPATCLLKLPWAKAYVNFTFGHLLSNSSPESFYLTNSLGGALPKPKTVLHFPVFFTLANSMNKWWRICRSEIEHHVLVFRHPTSKQMSYLKRVSNEAGQFKPHHENWGWGCGEKVFPFPPLEARWSIWLVLCRLMTSLALDVWTQV